jgi:hypothetical protein
MSVETTKLRLVVAREEGRTTAYPVFAISDDTWGVIPPDDWDRLKREACEKWLGPDWTAYDYAECVVSVPGHVLDELFQTGEITGTVETGDTA